MKANTLCPAIKIEPGDSESGSLQLACFPPTMDPLAPGIQVTVSQFRNEDGKLMAKMKGKSSGPMLFQGRELVEVQWSVYRQDRLAEKQFHWIEPAPENGLSILRLREQRTPDGTGHLEEVHLSFPGKIEPEQSFTQTDRYFQSKKAAEDVLSIAVSKPVNVTVDGKTIPCLMVMTRWEPETDTRLETYIGTASGNVVLQRTVMAVPGPETPPAPAEPHLCKTLFLVTYS